MERALGRRLRGARPLPQAERLPHRRRGRVVGRALIIRNPVAGRGRAPRMWPSISRRLSSSGFSFEEVPTGNPGEAASIAQASKHEIVIACGGDGTVHEVVNGLMRAGGKAVLGVIPV